MGNIVSVDMSLSGDSIDPNRITARLGIKPTHAWAKGDEYLSKSGRTLKKFQGVWSLSFKDVSVSDAVGKLSAVVLPRANDFLAVASEENATKSFSIWWEPEEGQGGFSIDSALIIDLIRLVDHVNLYFPGYQDTNKNQEIGPGKQ